MTDYTFLVTVHDEQARLTMAERLNQDEEAGLLEYKPLIGTPLHIVTTADAEAVMRRPLCAGEADSLRKTLESALQEEWSAAISEEDNPTTTDFGASGIVAGLHTIKEYGMDDWLTITKVDQHGDTMLLTGVDVDGNEVEFTLDIDEVVELLATGA